MTTNPDGLSDAEMAVLRRLKTLARTALEAGGNSRPDIDALSRFERYDQQCTDRYGEAYAVERDNFPPACRHVRAARPQQIPAAVKTLTELCSWREDLRRGIQRMGGVALEGKVGRGKTAIATMVAYYAAYLAGLRGSYISCQQMRRHLKGSFDGRELQHADYLAKASARDWQLVCLDDFGAEAGNIEAQDVARDVIDICSESCMFLILTTNKSPQDTASYLGDRHASRASALAWVRLDDGPGDIRKERL